MNVREVVFYERQVGYVLSTLVRLDFMNDREFMFYEREGGYVLLMLGGQVL